jgi:hypothetical protein
MVFAAQSVDESWQDGCGGIIRQRLYSLSSPQAHADEEDGTANKSDVAVVLARL